MIKIDTYFVGGGLFDLGLVRSGLTINKSYEIDKICCKVYKRNFDHEVIQRQTNSDLSESNSNKVTVANDKFKNDHDTDNTKTNSNNNQVALASE